MPCSALPDTDGNSSKQMIINHRSWTDWLEHTISGGKDRPLFDVYRIATHFYRHRRLQYNAAKANYCAKGHQDQEWFYRSMTLHPSYSLSLHPKTLVWKRWLRFPIIGIRQVCFNMDFCDIWLPQSDMMEIFWFIQYSSVCEPTDLEPSMHQWAS